MFSPSFHLELEPSAAPIFLAGAGDAEVAASIFLAGAGNAEVAAIRFR
jgi:hypothetical protein